MNEGGESPLPILAVTNKEQMSGAYNGQIKLGQGATQSLEGGS